MSLCPHYLARGCEGLAPFKKLTYCSFHLPCMFSLSRLATIQAKATHKQLTETNNIKKHMDFNSLGALRIQKKLFTLRNFLCLRHKNFKLLTAAGGPSVFREIGHGKKHANDTVFRKSWKNGSSCWMLMGVFQFRIKKCFFRGTTTDVFFWNDISSHPMGIFMHFQEWPSP